jgi:hypothetical protein
MKDLSSEIKQALLAPFEAAEIRIKTQPYIAAYLSSGKEGYLRRKRMSCLERREAFLRIRLH